MHPKLEALFDEAEKRYLKADELQMLSQYVGSLPERLVAYRTLRDRELAVMQQVADQLQIELPNEPVENLERAIKNALLTLRYCAMGMLMNDESFVRDRLMSWLGGPMRLYHNPTINQSLYRLLNQRLSQALGPQAMNLLTPHLVLAQTLIHQQTAGAATVQ